MNIRFDMGGVSCVYQTLDIPGGTYTKEEILNGLTNGDFVTSISSNGTVNNLNEGFREIGKVVACSHEHYLPYTDFQDCD